MSAPALALLSCLLGGLDGKPADGAAAFKRALASRAVYAGEQHDRAVQHQAQRDLLDALSSARGGVAAGFEMLYVTQQAALDRYLSGASTEEEFLEEVDWKKTWGFPFELYRPIFEVLRSKGLKGLALNAPNGLVKKVSRSGLGSLTAEDRALLPKDMKLSSDSAYLAMLAVAYRGHGGEPSGPRFQNYLDAMMVWNETMAEAVASYLQAEPGAQVVVIAGSGHAWDEAVPFGVARRLGPVPQTTFILAEAPSCPSQLPADDTLIRASYHWLLPSQP